MIDSSRISFGGDDDGVGGYMSLSLTRLRLRQNGPPRTLSHELRILRLQMRAWECSSFLTVWFELDLPSRDPSPLGIRAIYRVML